MGAATAYSGHAERTSCELSELVRARLWNEADGRVEEYLGVSGGGADMVLLVCVEARLTPFGCGLVTWGSPRGESGHYKEWRCAAPLGGARYAAVVKMLMPQGSRSGGVSRGLFEPP